MEAWRDELYHYGIKGQKWGRRRYQNIDGSLTNSGKIRYVKKSDSDNRQFQEANRSMGVADTKSPMSTQEKLASQARKVNYSGKEGKGLYIRREPAKQVGTVVNYDPKTGKVVSEEKIMKPGKPISVKGIGKNEKDPTSSSIYSQKKYSDKPLSEEIVEYNKKKHNIDLEGGREQVTTTSARYPGQAKGVKSGMKIMVNPGSKEALDLFPEKNSLKNKIEAQKAAYKANSAKNSVNSSNLKKERVEREMLQRQDVSQYDNLTDAERLALSDEERKKLMEMSPTEQWEYLKEIKKRQTQYLKSKTENALLKRYSKNHDDNRYNVWDKIRENITGKIDSDHAKAIKDVTYKELASKLRAVDRWEEKLEAVFKAPRWANTVSEALNNAEGELFINKAKSFARKIFG